MKKLNKKGSQVDFVLSFVIFVVALIFIYLLIVSSIPKKETKITSLSNLEKVILKKISSEIFVIRAHNLNSKAKCVSISEPKYIVGGSTIAINDSGSIPSSISGSNILVKSNEGAMKIFYSNLIKNSNILSSTNCDKISPDSVKIEKKILESKIINLMSNFSSNYSNLKNSLEVPSEMDFNLYFEYENGSVLGKLTKNPMTEVYSKDLEIYYLSTNASNEKGDLRIKIW